MAVTKQKKDEVLKELIEKFQKAQSVAFGQYSGMTVAELTTMRNEMRKVGVEFKVAKRTLIKLAAKELGVELPDEVMEGTVGVALSYDDAVSGPKTLKSTSKKVEVVKLLGGMMDGQVISVSQMQELADLPSREAMLAKFLGMLRSPLQSFHGALSSPLSSMVRAMQAYGDQKAV
jgi:large subunit ribosomal protein L10